MSDREILKAIWWSVWIFGLLILSTQAAVLLAVAR